MLLIKMLSVSGHSLDTEAKKNENILSGLPSESKKKKKAHVTLWDAGSVSTT